MFYKILGAWLYFSLCSLAVAQESFEVKGSVINAGTLEPIEGVNIIGKGLFAISSANGEFTIRNVAEGIHSFTISHLGHSSKTVTVKVGPEMEEVKVLLVESATNLEEVAVYGKTTSRKAQELPTASHQVYKDFLEENRENSLMQTLKKIPGVSTITIGSGQSKPIIRGLGFNRVAVVQNGIKHEAQQWGSDHGLEIDQYGIENMQIIKGPASLLYGSDAIAGVVDIQPSAIPKPNSFVGDLNLLGESNNNLLGLSTGIVSRKDKWFYRARLTFRDYGDYKVPTDRINYENYIFELHHNHLRNTVGEEANAAFSVGYVADHIKSETFFSNVYAKNGFFANAHGLEVRNSNIDYDRSSRDIDLPHHVVNHFKVTNTTTIAKGKHSLQFDIGFQNNYREEHSEPVPHGHMPKPEESKERQFNKNTYSINIRDAFNPDQRNDIVIGMNAELQQNTIGGWGFLIPGYHRFTLGIFAYDQIELNPNLHLQAGVRYDYGLLDTKSHYDWFRTPVDNPDGTTSQVFLQRAQDKTLAFGNFSASTGLSFIQNNTTFKINLGKSFRMPLANELASDGVNYHMYRFERGNLDLDAEESYQMDIDIDHTTERFSIGISPFINLFDNFIYLNPTSNYYEALQIYEYTQSKVFRTGGEIRASTRLFKNLQLDASGEFVYSRQTSGAKKGFTLPFSPPLSGFFSARYQFNKLLFFDAPQLIADYRITAAQKEIVPPEEKTEGYRVMHLSFMGKIPMFKENIPVGIRLKINNVFNTEYFDHTSFYRLIDVPEAGRNISLSITVPF